MPHVRAGTLRALGVTSRNRSTALPDTPTVAESGFAGYEVDNMVGVLVTAGTPKPIVAKLNTDVVRILNLPDVQKRFSDVGFDPVGNSPTAFSDYLKSEMAKWAKVIKDSGARVD